MVVLSDAKRAYDTIRATKEAGKAKTENFFRRVWEFVWPPARRHYAATTGVAPASELVVPAEIPALPRSVDEALEDYEACKNEEEAERMTDADKARAWSFFRTRKDGIKPPACKEEGPRSFKESKERAEAAAEARARGRHW